MPGIYNDAQLSSYVDALTERCRRLEDQVKLLSAQAGIPWADPTAQIPPEVAELARAGKQLDAIKLYREATGASMEEATEAIKRV